MDKLMEAYVCMMLNKLRRWAKPLAYGTVTCSNLVSEVKFPGLMKKHQEREKKLYTLCLPRCSANCTFAVASSRTTVCG